MVEGAHLEGVGKTMVGTLEEKTGESFPSIPDGLIFILSKVGNLLLQVRRLGRGMVASEELVRQVGERGDRSRGPGVQTLHGLPLQSEWEVPQLDGIGWDPIYLDSNDELVESPQM
ncbi:unnamed protein product [Linum trigynum]|uniref:Uncharacterized protein n=1 Tax=Linum trigynum TaxID=586398 RepID=A0AAV2GMU1_9ROSI